MYRASEFRHIYMTMASAEAGSMPSFWNNLPMKNVGLYTLPTETVQLRLKHTFSDYIYIIYIYGFDFTIVLLYNSVT